MPLLNLYALRTNGAQTRVKVVPTCDTPLEQCAAANVLHLRCGPATHFALRARGGGALVNALAADLFGAATRALARSGTIV